MSGPHLQITTSQTDEHGTTVDVRPLRPSVWSFVAGLILFAVGAAILYAEFRIALSTKIEPHILHMSIGAGFCFVGVLVPFGRYVFPPLKQLSVVVAPYVPVLGGRRAGDPAAPSDAPSDAPNGDDAPGKQP
jgi:hypothetical protein